MESREALKVLAELTASQGGMATSAQARARGVSHMNLTRLTESGDLVRLSHGVYRDSGAPGGEHDDLRAAWLASDPTRLADDRLREKPGSVVVSGESAAAVHKIGGLRARRSEFTTARRRQTQRADVSYRTRTLTADDVTVREGLPLTTPERTIADLVEQRTQLDHIGDALRDAARISRLDTDRLTTLLSPLAERNGHAKGDGNALLGQLTEAAHIDPKTLSKQIAEVPDLGALVARAYLSTPAGRELLDSPAFHAALQAHARSNAAFAESALAALAPAFSAIDKLADSIAGAAAAFDSPTMRSLLDAQQRQVVELSATMSRLATPGPSELGSIHEVMARLSSSRAGLGSDARVRLNDAVSAVAWASQLPRTASGGTDLNGEGA